MYMDCFTLRTPYPDERPRRRDQRLARRMLPLYSGAGGELGAISAYCYASLRTEEESPRLGELFEELAKTELLHFRLLGRLIRDLGVDPVIHTRIDGIGDDAHNNKIRHFLEHSLRREQIAADTYRYLLTQTDDRAVSALLERIAQDEEMHIALFSQLLNG